MKLTAMNCPNCGAGYDPSQYRCPYCGGLAEIAFRPENYEEGFHRYADFVNSSAISVPPCKNDRLTSTDSERSLS